MIGELLGHYRVLEKVGEGGMGVVYRAHDEVLHRDVALKALSDLVIERLGKEHLLQEARASSALNHPNICTVYEVVDAGDALYIAMELVEGKPLSDLVGENGLPIESVLRYGRQIAAALAHAHGRRIVHHDLKSSNIVVTPDGLVKVLDFGLARRLPPDAADQMTVTFTTPSTAREVSGTLSYMAPEVLRGEPGDARSDLWALGVVLYESAAGRLPFRGKTGFETSSAILKDMPAPLPSPVPPGLWSIIQRSLAKEPSQRYQQASEIKAALEAVEAAGSAGLQASGQPSGYATTVVRGMRHLRINKGDVLLLVGTTKGAFVLRSTVRRTKWDVAGPYFHGHAVYAMAYDDREDRRRLWASTQNYWGTFLRCSDDYGRSWTNPLEANVKFPADCGVSINNIWQIALDRHDPRRMYCGVEPAALFESSDAGESWSLVRGLFDHPHRPRWVPGSGGLALHTILQDPVNPQRMYVAISTGGVYRTEDGGQSWDAREPRHSRGVPAGEISGVRSVRAQDGAAPGTAGAPVPAAPLGTLPIGRRRRQLAGHRAGRAVGLRISDGGPPARPGHRLHRADRVGRIPMRTGRTPARVPDAQRRRVVGSRSRAVCRRRAPTRPFCETRWPPTRWIRPVSTSAPAADRCSDRASRVRAGLGSSADCRRSCA